ncbi:hypothetical protein [Leekyejoonella antrihumi]|uniref:Uncharacterized protein n=1 Tax=Leekyejoonella antrihumi TaxID=1660198 RepID=A0A563DZH8_9MICO|nr:hypothetical protein [Leekyejoonella antrihumi]TWP35595.1 hypothetical protein FGL98_13540 [Leekyejoonella antrihumi]
MSGSAGAATNDLACLDAYGEPIHLPRGRQPDGTCVTPSFFGGVRDVAAMIRARCTTDLLVHWL